MSETEFTKGPWVAKMNAAYFDICAPYAQLNSGLDERVCIGVMPDQEANAHLIAAAPEMYEMLEKIHEGIAGVGEYGEFYYDAKDLLAKARGEHD